MNSFKKKALIILASLFMMTSTCFAYVESYEPEADGSVSYSVCNNIVTFVNYAKNDNTNEYWIRILPNTKKFKLLHYITLNIDNVPYTITAINNPTEKYTLSGLGTIDQSDGTLFFNVSSTSSAARFFVLPDELVAKLKTAKSAYILMNSQKAINIKWELSSKYLANVNTIYSHKYADFSSLWKPEDMSKD